MNAWETEDEYASTMAAQRALPTPSDTPSRKSSRRSRRSSRKHSISPVPASSPGPMPHSDSHNRRESRDISTDESISILDPRRFTPTLHANLVAEILNLRRDQEDKLRLIENLETTLHGSRNEIDTLSDSLASVSKESRSLKRQLALLEGGTSNALGELAKERDEAVDAAADLKKRLETSQKKARAIEEDSDKVHALWAKDKDAWDDERRKFERKLHVAEGRLRTVLEEFAAYQASHAAAVITESESEEAHHARPRHGSDSASIRSMTNSVRFSVLPNGMKTNGMSLADELNFEDESDATENYADGRESVLSTTHRRTASRDSVIVKTHKHSQSIESLRRPGSVARARLHANQMLEGRIVEGDEEGDVQRGPNYVDCGVQMTPPASPKPTKRELLELLDLDDDLKSLVIDNINGILFKRMSMRDRATTPPPAEPEVKQAMVSSACQTVEQPLSPPETPSSAAVLDEYYEPECMSIATQTEEELTKLPAAPPKAIFIPSISIHPPTSQPGTPKTPLLPQQFKDVGCQAYLPWVKEMCESSMQTEEILVQKRMAMLPEHLQPSFITSCPPSPEPPKVDEEYFTPSVVPPPRNPRRMKSNQSLTQSINDVPSSPPVPYRAAPPPPASLGGTTDAYPGNNDDGPLSDEKAAFRRPHRISSLFAGFENMSSDDAEDFADADMSDSDYRTALSAPKPRKALSRLGKRNSMAPTSVPEDVEPEEENTKEVKKHDLNGNSISNSISSNTSVLPGKVAVAQTAVRQLDKPLTLVMPGHKQGSMRRAALVSNGIAAHQGRSRSPSLPEPYQEPPFPIPTRASSRKPPFSASAPSDGNRSPTRDMWSRRNSRIGHYRVNSIRKVRSAAAIPETRRARRRGSRSPPPFCPSTTGVPESPQLPPMPNNDLTSPFIPGREPYRPVRYSSHRKQASNNTANTFNTDQTGGSSVQATSVVDAIAQTMVGEWMYKYVRRRKSFGVPDNGGPDDGANGVRHKRWVWLAPYERAVMWSSKQPTSGSALMGKSGRKLTIQSVLDVKDDNPAPKGVANLFDRSILILTPARALKFTATTRERHYLWLTALSFLAHSSQAIPEVIAPVPPPDDVATFDVLRPSAARLRKAPIRDSIRIAKDRGPQSGPPTAQSSIYKGREHSIRTERTDRTDRTDTSTRGAPSSIGDPHLKDSGFGGGPDIFYTDAASPPVVPRFTDRTFVGNGHGRKRSNTGPRMPPPLSRPPLSFRGFSERGPVSTAGGSSTSGGGNNGGGGGGGGGGAVGHQAYPNFPAFGHAPASSTAGMSVGTNGSSDMYGGSHYGGSQYSGPSLANSHAFSAGMASSNRTSIRTSDASSRPNAVVNNFFEAVGTVRMEAFISPMAQDYGSTQVDDLAMNSLGRGGPIRRRSRERRRRSRNRDSYYRSRMRPADYDDWYSGSKTAGEEEYRSQRMDDPFHGF